MSVLCRHSYCLFFLYDNCVCVIIIFLSNFCNQQTFFLCWKNVRFTLEFYIQLCYLQAVLYVSEVNSLCCLRSMLVVFPVACLTDCLLLLSDSQKYLAWYPLNSISHLKALHTRLSGLISSGMFWNFFVDKLSSRNSCIFWCQLKLKLCSVHCGGNISTTLQCF